MEPLVVFGAGLVIYCGYLAALDEIRVFKRCYAKRRTLCSTRASKTAKGRVRPVAAKGAACAGSSGYTCGGRLLVSEIR